MAELDVGANLEALREQQKALQTDFTKNKMAYYKAQKIHHASKVELSVFETKYGRVLQLLGE